MVVDIRQRLLASFEVEHREHLEAIRALLGNGSAEGEIDLAEVYRRAHSLKGAARAVDLEPVETLAHRLETLFSQVQEGIATLDEPTRALISTVLDAIEDWVTALSPDNEPPAPAEALAQIEQWLAGTRSQTHEAPGDPLPATGKGGGTAAPPPEERPPATESGDAAALAGAEPGEPAAETLRIRAAQLDRLLSASGILLEDGIREESVSEDIKAIAETLRGLEHTASQFRSKFGSLLRQLDESPEHRRLVSYVNDLDSQIRVLARRAKNVAGKQDSVAWSIRQHVAGLQDEVVATRMVTADSVFIGFRKMVRDLARDEGKDVAVVFRGLETDADRLVLQGLKDGVMHMLRNAVSHGLETPEQREADGKPRKGQIVLDVSTHAGRLNILVDDDGRGIDLDRVREIAVLRGLMDSETAASVDRARLCEFLCDAGFSTAREVTSISGRGVGLSAAVEAAVRLQGTMEFPEKVGPGTSVIVSVPMRVSNQRIVFVTCGCETFGLQTSVIEKLLKLSPIDIATIDGQPTVRYGNDVLPLRALGDLVGIGRANGKNRDQADWAIIVRTGLRRLALRVDGLQYVRDAVVKELDGAIPHADFASGAVLMHDGSVIVVLNLMVLINAPAQQEQRPAGDEAPALRDHALAEILVVDDSITTRTLERSILEAHGYRVRISVDGVDALRAMRDKLPDVVVSDVEMPRLDGFGLLREIKQDQYLAKIPVILVTSRDSEEDRSHGMNLGADDYIIKGKFDQRSLLTTIERLL